MAVPRALERIASRSSDVIAVLVVWTLILFLFWRLITPDVAARDYYVTGDFTWKEQAQDIVVARSWAHGALPLWNPYIYAGQPLAADPGVGLFYPIGFLFDVTAGSGGVPLLRLEWRVIIDFFLASALAYLFLRKVTERTLPALGGTLLYTFSGYLTSFPPHQLDILETGSWLPLLLLSIHQIVHHPAPTPSQRWRWTLVAALAFGLTLLAGHPQTALLACYLAAAYAGYRMVTQRMLRAAVPHALVAIALGLGIASMQVFPSLEFFPLSNRVDISSAAARLGLKPSALPDLVLPHYAGEAALYLGGGVLALALYGAWRCWRQGGGFWIGTAIIALLLSLGGHEPLYPLFAKLGFSLIRDQSRAVFLTTFATTVLASLGLAELWQRPRDRWLLGLSAVLCALGPLATVLLHRAGDTLASGVLDTPPALRASLALVVAAISLVSLGGNQRWRGAPMTLASTLLIALLTFDGLAVNWWNNITPQPPAVDDGLPSTIRYLQALPQPFRVATDGDSLIPANDLGNYGIQTDQGYNDFRLASINTLLISSNTWRVWQLLDVHEFLTTRTFGAPFTLQHIEGHVHTYGIAGTLPRIWAVWQYTVISQEHTALTTVLGKSFDPGQRVVLNRAPDLNIPVLPQHAQQIRERTISPEQTIVMTTLDRPAIVIRSTAYYPGWIASIDGRPAPLLRADGAIQAVAVPAGTHTIVFSFDPWSIKIGLGVSGLSIFLMLTLLLATYAPLLARAPGQVRRRVLRTPAAKEEVH
ncbi:MAG: YfhO family protein [Chloroflexi bacterium]|nr:YfhO family protein [Chloroflexota bacterium]